MVSFHLLFCLHFLIWFPTLFSWFGLGSIYPLGDFYFLMFVLSAVWHDRDCNHINITLICCISWWRSCGFCWCNHVFPFSLQSRVCHFSCTLTAPQWADNASCHPSIHCKPKCTYSNCHPCKCTPVVLFCALCVSVSVSDRIFCTFCIALWDFRD